MTYRDLVAQLFARLDALNPTVAADLRKAYSGILSDLDNDPRTEMFGIKQVEDLHWLLSQALDALPSAVTVA